MSDATTRRVEVNYTAASDLVATADGSSIVLALDNRRGAIGVRGRVKTPAVFRDALMTAVEILGSDLRYRRRDRAAYLAYLAKKGKKATKEIWEAQKAFLDEQLGDEEKPTAVLEPILTVHPDEISFEVFSRDESCYARLALANDLFEGRAAAHGTAAVDLPADFLERLDRLRSYLPVSFDAGTKVTGRPGETRTLDVPYAWIRGFLQVQSAATLPAVSCELAPIDLYNVLYALRTRKAKTSPRALRFELIPGAPPRLILEPWEIVLESHGAPYRGSAPRVVRTFGRQRLLTLARLLPHVRSARVQLLGAGLPVFWVLDLGAGVGSLTLGLTGWTESGWSSAAAFDALMPPASAQHGAARVRALLEQRGPLPFAEITAGTFGGDAAEARAALQLESLRGRVVYDMARDLYRPRALLGEPIDEAQIRYGNPREQRAHRLLGDGAEGTGQVTITKIHDIAGEGTEIVGEVIDKEARRSYKPAFTLDAEGRVSGASCACPSFRRAGLREGPCEHMIALRLAWARRRAAEEAMRLTPEGRKLIRAETRTYVRREPSGAEMVYRVSLDDKRVAVQWGARATAAAATEPRRQQFWYDSDAEARTAYFARLEHLAAEGFIDADASVG